MTVSYFSPVKKTIFYAEEDESNEERKSERKRRTKSEGKKSVTVMRGG